MVTNQTPSPRGSTSSEQIINSLQEGDRLRLPSGQILTIETVDRAEWRADRFDIAEVVTRSRFSHRAYDLRRAIEAGAEVLTR